MSSTVPTAAPGPLLEVRDLVRRFTAGRRLLGKERQTVLAVDEVSFTLGAGETLALVGESGSGKSTTARLVLRLLSPESGSIRFDGVDWLALGPSELRSRRSSVGVVFQDPASSLNPRMSVASIVGEPLAIHRIGSKEERRARVLSLVRSVGLPESALEKRPGEFSGGQRQRIGVARALATDPKLVVLDEPVSALDVSVRAQVLNLLAELQETSPSRPAYLFIGHDLGVVRQFADRTAVMYLGRIVEEGPTEELFRAPRHPYTALLLASQPGPRSRTSPEALARRRTAGEPSSASAVPPGCAFHPRCPSATAECRVERPPASTLPGPSGHRFRCYHPEG